MPARFILGRAGTGKTQHCLTSATQWAQERGIGVPVFLLVPQQATFNTERMLACGDAARARLNVRVVSFDSLARELGMATRGRDVFVSARGRRMVLAQILRENAQQLRYFRDTATQPHLAARLEAAIAEIQQELLSVEQIEAVLQGSPGTGGRATADKLYDLQLITAAYERYLGQDRIDPTRRLQQLEAQILNSPLVKDSLVLVDGFAGFTGMQIRLLIALARPCARMDLCFLLDGDGPGRGGAGELGIFARTRRTYLRVVRSFREAGIAVDRPVVLGEVRRFGNDALRAIERQWESDRPTPVSTDRTEVALVEATDLEQEVAFAARQVRKWQIQEVRLREIGILCRNLEPYAHTIRRVFVEHGIACFIDRRRALASHPLIRYLRVVLQITQRGWQQQAVVELLKTGLSGLGSEEADFLENFALKHGIDRSAWVSDAPWEFVRSHAGEDEAPEDERQANARADALRQRLTAPIRKLAAHLQKPRKMREHVRELYDLLLCQEHGVRTRLGEWSKREHDAGNPEGAQEHQQAWKQVMDLLDDAARLLGEVEAAGEHFVQTIEAGLEDLDLALTPPTLDQVMVGQIDRSRSPEFKKVIVMGLNEGEFPMLFAEDPIFSDAERQVLQDNNLEFAPGAGQQVLAENLLGYIAMTRASETLVLTRPLANGDGRETTVSPFVVRVRKIVDGLKPVPASHGGVDTITSPAQAAIAIVEYLNHKAAGLALAEPRPYEELSRWVFDQSEDSPVAGPAHFAQRGMAYENLSRLSDGQLKRLYQAPLVSSVSRLEAFAACPFRHFAQYGLKLRTREVAELSSLDLGNAFHFVMERLVRQIIQQRGTWQTVTEAQIDELADEVAKQLRNELLLSSARNRYLLSHIKSTLRRVLRDQQVAEQAGAFRPLGAEIVFGNREDAVLNALEITTPKTGQKLLLQGKIDRVDWVEDELRIAVYDYKMRGKKLELKRVLNGLTLQLLAYLLVLEQQGSALAGGKKLTAAGAFYVQLLRGMQSAKVPGEPLADGELEAVPQGYFCEDAFELFDSRTGPGESSGVLNAKRNKDGGVSATSTSCMAAEELDALLAEVRRLMGELAEDLLSGNVKVEPYRLNKSTPCEYCDYRCLCRIDPLLNRYRSISRTRETELREGLVAGKAAMQ